MLIIHSLALIIKDKLSMSSLKQIIWFVNNHLLNQCYTICDGDGGGKKNYIWIYYPQDSASYTEHT